MFEEQQTRISLTSFQQEAWLANEALPETHPGFSFYAMFILKKCPDIALLREALRGLLQQFPLLGATLEKKSAAMPVFVMGAYPEPELTIADVTAEAEPEAAEQAILRDFQEQSFVPLGGRLMRFILVRGPRHCWLCFNYFHVIGDGSGSMMQFSVLSQIYANLKAGRPALSGEPASWQRVVDADAHYLASSRAARDKTFWAEHMRRMPEERFFQPLAGRPDVPGDIVMVEHRFSRAARAGFETLVQRHGISMPALLAAVYGLTLSQLYNVPRVAVQLPAYVGERKDLLRVQGYNINLTPLVVEAAPEATFAAVAEAVRQECRLLQLHAKTCAQTGMRAQGQLKNFEHIWDTNLNFFSVMPKAYHEDFQTDEKIPYTTAMCRQDALILGLFLLPMGDGTGLRVIFSYSQNYFTATDIRRFMARMEKMVDWALEHGDRPLSDCSLVLDEELQQLAQWEQGAVRPQPCTSIPAQFEAVATAHAQASAVCGEDGSVRSYAQVRAAAALLARRLRAAGVQRGDVVAVLARRDAALPETVLGVMAAGAVYLPVDPEYPADRVRYMLEDSAARVLLTLHDADAALEAVAHSGIAVLSAGITETEQPKGTPGTSYIKVAAAQAAEDGESWYAPLNSEEPAYLIYTSGSTGKPKGVLVPHRAFLNMIQGQISLFGVTPQDHVLQFASPSFDASLSEIFMALLCGAALYPVPLELILTPWNLHAYMTRHAVSVVTFPPSYLTLFQHEDFPSLRVMLTAGEAPVAEDARYYAEKLQYFNAYGPTEAAVCAAAVRVLPQSSCAAVGGPLPNTQAYVLDGRGQRAAPGITGELWLAGAGLALGYLRRPEVTAAAFRAPACLPETRCYRTGDRARWLPDGSLMLMGRADDQVKVRGHRIELGELTAAVEACTGVAQAAVLVVSKDGDKLLVAFVQPRAGGQCSEESVRSELSTHLPRYMLPSLLCMLERLPLSPTGKVDKKALAERALHLLEDAAPEVHWTEHEARVAAQYAAVLGHSVPDPCRSFFSMGGDSLTATGLLFQLESVCGFSLPMREFFQDSSVRAVAARMCAAADAAPVRNREADAAAHGAARAEECRNAAQAGTEQTFTGQAGIGQAGTEAAAAQEKHTSEAHGAELSSMGQERGGASAEATQPVLLHASQLAIWAQECRHSGSLRYIMPFVIGVRGTQAQARQFAQAVHAALSVQPLCTAVVGGDIDAPAFLPFTVPVPPCVEEDARGPEGTLPAEAQRELLDARIHVPFDLVHTAPARLHLLRVAEDRWILLLTLHHLAADGVSLTAVLRDAAVHYAGGSIAALPRTAWLRKFSAEEKNYLASAEAQEDIHFWREYLGTVPPRFNPAGGSNMAGEGAGWQLGAVLSAECLENLRRLAVEGSCTLLACMLGLLGEFLRQRMGMDMVLAAVPTGTRDSAALWQTCGYFVNPVPVRLEGAATLTDVVRQAGEALRQAAAHNRYPAHMLPQALGLGHGPLTDILVTHMDVALPALPELAELAPHPVLVPLHSAKTAFAFNVATGKDDTALLVLEYDCACAQQEEAQALLDAWAAFVRKAASGVLPVTAKLGDAPAGQKMAPAAQNIQEKSSLAWEFDEQTMQGHQKTVRVLEDGGDTEKPCRHEVSGTAAHAPNGAFAATTNASGERNAVHASSNAPGAPTNAGVESNAALAAMNTAGDADAALTEAWQQVLGCAATEDCDFFLHGGDSIKVIQLIGRLRRAGITCLTPAHCFEHVTLGALRACMHVEMAGGQGASLLETAPAQDVLLPLLPLQQRWVTKHPNTWRAFHTGMPLRLSAAVEAARLREGFLKLGARHEALRLRFTEQGAHCGRADATAEGLWLTLDCAAEQSLAACFAAASHMLFPRVNCTEGPLYGAVLMTRGAERYLLLGVHHFAADIVSLEFLRADLAAFCKDGAWMHPAPACGAATWAQAVAQRGVFAGESALAEEVTFWKGLHLEQGGALEALRPEGADRTALRRLVRERVVYDAADKRARADLLASLAVALGTLRQKEPVLVTLEGHGREALLNGVDITQTVGWFTAAYPVLVRPAPQDASAPAFARTAATAFADMLSAMPAHGARYGFAVARHAELDCAAQIGLNYFGVVKSGDASGGADDAVDAAGSAATSIAASAAMSGEEAELTFLPEYSIASALPEMLAADFTPDNPLDVLAFGSAATAGEEGMLTLEASFSPEKLPVDWVEHLMRAWVKALTELRQTRLADEKAVRETLAQVSLCAPEDVAEVGEPDPAQEAMLFQYLLDAEAGHTARYYTQQIWFTLRGGLDAAALESAWQQLAARHEVLRTVFPRMQAGEFRRVVLKKARLSMERHDISGLPQSKQLARREAVLKQQREEGFDLACGPLLMLTLFRRTDEDGEICWDMAWCFTHLLMDGWCIGIMLRELFILYAAAHRDIPAALPAAPSLAAYRLALAGQDEKALVEYWQAYLQDVPAPLPLAGPETAAPDIIERTLTLDSWKMQALNALAGRCSVTLPLLLQSAWALLLGADGGRQDVTFGLVVSGRPASVPEVEQMLGLFIRTLPVRVRWAEKMSLAALADTLRQNAAVRAPHEMDALADIQRCHAGGGALFDHLLVFENYPLDGIDVDGAPCISAVGGWERQPYALALSVLAQKVLSFRVTCDISRVPDARLQQLCADWLRLLDILLEDGADSLTCGALMARLRGEPDGQTMLAAQAAEKVHALDEGLTRFAGESRVYERDASVPQLFAAMAKQMPLATACINIREDHESGDDRWTYEELHTAAARVAAALHGLHAGEPVALAMPRQPEAVAVMLGITAAGGCFLPLDEHIPPVRTRHMLDITQCRRIIYWDAESAWLTEDIRADREMLAYGACMEALPAVDLPPIAAEQPAYIMFTSGTTGMPKAVAVPHRGIVRLVRNTNFLHVHAGERMLQTGTFCFDASTLELWAPLLNGGTVCFADTDTVLSPQRLRAVLEQKHIRIAWLTASLFTVLAMDSPEMFAPLRALYTGGEAMNVPAAANVLRACPHLELYNGYGPTENTTFTAVHRVTAQDVREGVLAVPLGRPVANTRVYILAEGGRLAAAGEWGEICAAGDGLALGYLGNDEATARAFDVLPAPVGERVYHTGDIGRWREDGCLEFQGRRDGQIKIRGYRVELSDVENALTQLNDVQEAAVIAVGDGADKRLVAFVTLARQVAPQVVRRALRGVLPAYMVPAAVRVRSALPVTVNGKRDKAALLALEQQLSEEHSTERAVSSASAVSAQPEGQAAAQAGADGGAALVSAPAQGPATLSVPVNGNSGSGDAVCAQDVLPIVDGNTDDTATAASSLPAEGAGALTDAEIAQTLRQIFAEVLKISMRNTEGDADFFALGGQSLKAIRLQAAVNTHFKCTLSIREVMDDGHISALTARIRQQMSGGAQNFSVESAQKASTALPQSSEASFVNAVAAPVLPAALPAEAREYPMTPAQEQLWFLQRMHPESIVYNVLMSCLLEGSVDVDVLRRTLLELEKRHEALRLRLPAVAGGQALRQRVAPAGALTLDVRDCRAEAAPEAAAATVVQAWLERPFIFGAEQPLVRAGLARTSATTAVLCIILHHSICDGWSASLLLQDFYAVYTALLRGQTPARPASSMRYVDYVEQLRRRLASPEGKAMLERQAARLTPMPEALRLPADFPRAAEQTFAGDVVVSTVNRADMDGLRALGRRCDTTVFPVLFSLLSVLLYRHTGQTDMVLGMPAACRTVAETQNVAGLFFNVLPVRLRLHADEDFSACVRQTARMVREVLDDQECPVEDIVQKLALPRLSTRNLLYDVLVGYEEKEWLPQLENDMLRMRLYPAAGTQSRLDMSIYLREQQDGSLEIHWEYSTELFTRASIERIVARFTVLIHAVCASSTASLALAKLPLLPEQELAQLAAFNATARGWDISGGMDRCFTAQASRLPEAVALRCDDGSVVTYGQFAGQVGRMAAWLRAQGVKAGMPVGVCFPRGAALMTALFAVQRCGAYYVPFVLHLPQERVRAMLEDVPPQCVLLTDEANAEALRLAVATPALAERGTRVLTVDWAAMQAMKPCPPVAPAPDALAYILFTSGSTGRPKGVMVEQRGVLNRVFWMQSQFPLDEHDVILQKTPISFDVSVWELFWWAWEGASLALLAPGAEGNPEALVEAVAQHRVTTMHFVPSMLRTFLEYLDHHPAELARLGSLRRVFASGEALTLDCVRLFNRLLYTAHGTELHNLYGPTEATVDVTWQSCSPLPENAVRVPIGRPVSNTAIAVLDAAGGLAPLGAVGEIVISGVQVARGYSNRPEQTQAAFDVDEVTGARRYHTGDLGRWLPSGALEYWGRRDNQIKIRGFRIELNEVEAALEECPSVAQAVARVGSMGGLPALEAYLLPVRGARLTLADVRTALGRRLPEYMYPSAFFIMDAAPLNANGKADRKALHGRRLLPEQGAAACSADSSVSAFPTAAQSGAASGQGTAAGGDVAAVLGAVRTIWREILPEAGDIAPDTGFFDAGGTSLLLARLHDALNNRWPNAFRLPELFVECTMRRQAECIAGMACAQEKPVLAAPVREASGAVAIIGMAVRLADYDSLDALWTDVLTGADRQRSLPAARRQEQHAMLAALGMASPDMDFCDAAYLDDIAGFDCRRFGMAPADARVIDPEQRLFFATALRALEDAGYGGKALDGKAVGVFVGASPAQTFKMALTAALPEQQEQTFMLNVPSAIATRLSYAHDWQGPAALVDTACSSGLVAVLEACTALRRGDCPVALAGAARVQLAALRQETSFAIASASGQTRTFDAEADGTSAGEGAIAFLLKPLERALADGDAIHAVLLGGACNQDGHSAGVAAPNPAAQAEVIRAAAQDAGVPLRSLSFIEAHGTGTALGDPIEIEGLTRAFAGAHGADGRNGVNSMGTDGGVDGTATVQGTESTHAVGRQGTESTSADSLSRPIGSVKGNFGHLDAAAGALGMAKAVLSLQHGCVPRQPYFTAPNPHIDFAHAPVHVAAETEHLAPQLRPWRCGVSAFGLSGINAHVILQEAPTRDFPPEAEGWCCVPLSASHAAGLRHYAAALLAALEAHPEYPAHAVAATLTAGREHLACRAVFTVRTAEDLRAELIRWLLGDAPCATRTALTAQSAHGEARQDVARMEIFAEESAARAAARQFMDGAMPAYAASSLVPFCRVHLPFPPFQLEQCWPAFSTAVRQGRHAARAALLAEGVEMPQGWSFSLPLRDAAFWPMAEHRVAGVPTLVGMTTPALLGDALRRLHPATTVVVEQCRWLHPVRTDTAASAALLLTAENARGRDGEQREAVHGGGEQCGVPVSGQHFAATLTARDEQGAWTTCVEARVHCEHGSSPAPLDMNTLHVGLKRVRTADAASSNIAAAAHGERDAASAARNDDTALVQVSGRWNCRRQLWRSADAMHAVALLEVPERYQQDMQMTAFHPALLDAAVSLCLTGNMLPAACTCVRLYAPVPARVWARVLVRPSAAPQTQGHARVLVADCVIADEQGQVLATFDGLTFMTPPSEAARLHRLEWTPVSVPPVEEAAQKELALGSVALLGQGVLCDRLATAWEQQGITVTRHDLPQTEAACDALAAQWRESRPRTVCQVLPEMPLESVDVTDAPSPQNDMMVENAGKAAAQEQQAAWQRAALLRAVLRAGLADSLRWLCLGRTLGGQAVPEHALTLGLLLAAQEEEPRLHACFVDMPELTAPEASPVGGDGTGALKNAEADHAVKSHAAVENNTAAGSIAITCVRVLTALPAREQRCGWLRLDGEGGLFRPVLSAPVAASAEDCPVGDAAHCVVITGGLGGMGLTLAAGLAPRLGGSVALLHRGVFPEESAWPALAAGGDVRMAERAAALLALRRAAVPFRLYSCDICDAAALSATLARVRQELGPVGAVVHAAGVAGGGFLLTKDAQTFDAVLAPKVTGVRLLHALTRQDPVRFFILASSRTGLTGAAGQTEYTAANAYLDAFARWRAAQGLPALAVDWNTWADTGMAARMGVRASFSLKPAEAVPTLLRALGSGAAQLAVSARGESLSRPASGPESGPEPHSDASAAESALAADGLNGRTVTEYIVAVVEQVLGYEGRLTPQDDFYALGGDSLSGSRVVNAVNKALHVSIGLADILMDGRLGAFAARVEQAMQGEQQAAVQNAPQRDVYPVSREQLAVLRAVAAAEPHTAYNLPQFLPLPDTADKAAVERALSALVARHEALRTGIEGLNTPEPVMRILPVQPCTLEEYSFPSLHAAAEVLVRPFVMEESLFRAALIHVPVLTAAQGAEDASNADVPCRPVQPATQGIASNTTAARSTDQVQSAAQRAEAGEAKAAQRMLFIDVHHAVADARAVGIVLAELSALLADKALPPAPLHMKDAAWQEQQEDARTVAAARDYWLAHFANPLPQLNLPADFPRPAWHTNRGAGCTVLVPVAVVRTLQQLAGAQAATLNNVFFSMWAALLAHEARTEDLVIDLAADGREAAFTGTVGMFASLLPVRLAVHGGTFAELLRQTKQKQTEALRHRAFPLGSLLAELKPPMALDRTVLAEVQYSFMNYGRPAEGMLKPVLLPVTSCKADISIFGSETAEGVLFALEYYADLFSAARMEALGQKFLTLLTTLAAQGAQCALESLFAARQAVMENMETEHTEGAEDISARAHHLAQPAGARAVTLNTAVVQESCEREGTPASCECALSASESVSPCGRADDAVPDGESGQRQTSETGLDALVLEVFRTFFNDGTLEADDNFFDCGGHSLLALQIINALNARLRLSLTVRDLFTHPEAASLAAHVRSLGAEAAVTPEASAQAAAAAAIPALPARADGLYPLSHAQQRLYVLQQTEGGAEAYAMLFPLHCAAVLDETRFRRALASLLRRHEVLRTSFTLCDGELRQQVHAEVSVPCVFHPAAASEQDACLLTLREAMRPFALDSAPLLRVSVCPAPDGGMYMTFGMHHIIGDGWSMQIFFGELMRLYEDSAAPLPALPVQYRDYACWQQGRDWTEAAAYWRAVLKNLPAHVVLPVDAAPAAGPHPAGVISRVLPAALMERARAYAAGARVSLASCLLTLFAALLRRLTRQSDMLIGMGVAGRERTELEGLIGFFVNILPIRITFHEDEDFSECLHRVGAACAEAVARQDYPFDLLVRECAPATGAERGKQLVNIMFEYQRYSDVRGINTLDARQDAVAGSRIIPAEEWTAMAGTQGPAAKYALTLFVQDEPQGCRLRAEYDSALFTAPAVEQWLTMLEKLLTRVSTRSSHEA